MTDAGVTPTGNNPRQAARSHPPSKIAIVGAGAVGATLAYACMIRGVAKRIALYDLKAAKVTAESLDLNHGLQFVPACEIEGSDDPAVCAGADVVVLTAGAKQHPGQSRLDLAAANVALCRALVPKLVETAPNAILLVVTNPVDVLTYVALKLSGLPAGRVFGSGTVLDSSRFRHLIAQRCRVAVQNVHAYVAGEHGDSEVPLWSSASIANVPLRDWAVRGHGKLTVRDRTEIFQNVKQAAHQIIEGKGATNYAIGLAAAHILEAVLRDENRVLPVSSLMKNYKAPSVKGGGEGGEEVPGTEAGTDAGIDDVCLSVPSLVNRGGVDAVLDVPLNAAEEAGLRHSAETIQAAVRQLGF